MIEKITLTEEARNEHNKIKEMGKTVDREDLVYRRNEYTYSFKNFRAINTLSREIYNGTITLKEADKDQSSLLVEIINFKRNIKPWNQEKKNILEKKIFLRTCMHSFMVEKEFWTYRFFRLWLF